jgi:hypothetical protein
MSEPTRRDREVAVDVAEFTCDLLTSRSLYEAEELAVRDIAGQSVAAYREECERAERERVIALLEACSPFDTMSDVIAKLEAVMKKENGFEKYECWDRMEGRGESEAFDSVYFESAAIQWCESNWPSHVSDSEMIDVVVRCDRTGELRVFTMERHVEYEAFENRAAAVQLADRISGDEP